MTKGIRALALAATGALALVWTGASFAAINPKLSIGSTAQTGNSTTAIEARVGASDDAVARIQVYLPAGFKLNAPAGGAEVGTVSTTAISTQIGPPFLMTGTITAIGVTDPAVAWENANCDPAAHVAAWIARVQGGGDAWTFAVFVDQTTGAETSFGQLKLVACFKPTSLDTYGNKLISLSLGLKVLAAPTTPGTYRWRSLWTPFNANAATLNEAGNVEAQSIAQLQTGALTIAGKRSGKAHVRITLTGRLIVGGEPLGGAIVALRHGPTTGKLVALGSAKTSKSGTFVKVVTLRNSQYFQAGTTVGGQDLGAAGCTASFGSVPCVSATNARIALLSRLLHFRR